MKCDKKGLLLYAVTDRSWLNGETLYSQVEKALQGGATFLQLREKELDEAHFKEEAIALKALCRQYGVPFVLDDNVALAIETDADGVHVGQEDLPVEAVRRLVGPDMIIGLSTHTPDQARAAVASGADYIGVGPIYPTQTKKDVCAAVTLDYLDWVVANITLPFVAIGGIKRHNIADVIAHGARCCAIVSEFVSAPDIPARVAEVRSAMKK